MEHEAFKAASGSSFALSDGKTLTLHQVSDITRAQGIASFSLLFRGAVQFEQGIVSLQSDEHGVVDLFLVPVGIGGDEYDYEAIFTSVEQAGVA